MNSWFYVKLVPFFFFLNTFSSEIFVLSDKRSFRNLTFYNVLAGQVLLFSIFQALRDINGSPIRLSRRSKDELSLQV